MYVYTMATEVRNRIGGACGFLGQFQSISFHPMLRSDLCQRRSRQQQQQQWQQGAAAAAGQRGQQQQRHGRQQQGAAVAAADVDGNKGSSRRRGHVTTGAAGGSRGSSSSSVSVNRDNRHSDHGRPEIQCQRVLRDSENEINVRRASGATYTTVQYNPHFIASLLRFNTNRIHPLLARLSLAWYCLDDAFEHGIIGCLILEIRNYS